MRKFLLLLILGVLLQSQLRTSEQSQLPDKDFLGNPGFELGKAKWSGSVTAPTLDTSTPMDGAGSLDWNPTTTTGFLRSELVAIPVAYRGTACRLEFKYSWDSGVAGYITATVDDGTNDLFTPTNLNVTSSSLPGTFTAGFICPSSGSIRVELTNPTANDPASIKIDNVWLGSDHHRRGVVGDTAELCATVHYPATANCQWTSTASGFTDFAADADCPAPTVTHTGCGVTISTTETDKPEVTLSNMQSGKYVVTSQAPYNLTVGTAAAIRIDDGTDVADTAASGISGGAVSGTLTFASSREFIYSTPQASKTFRMQADTDGTITIKNTTFRQGQLEFKVYRFPTQSPSDTVTLETAGSDWQAVIAGANPQLGTASVSPFTHISNTSLSLTAASHSFAIGIACTTPATEEQEVGDTTCTGSEGDEVLGITINAPNAGKYKFCYMFNHFTNVNNGDEQADVGFRIVETANNSTTALNPTESLSQYSALGGRNASQNTNPIEVCQKLNFTSAGKKRVVLQYASTISGTFVAADHLVAIDGTSGNYDPTSMWTVENLSVTMPQAVALNNIETGAGAGGCTKGNLCSGTWTGTTGGGVSMTSTGTPLQGQWTQVGHNVIGSVQITGVDPAAGANTARSFTLTLPVAPLAGTFSSTSKAAGNCIMDQNSGVEEPLKWNIGSTNGAATITIQTFTRNEDEITPESDNSDVNSRPVNCMFQYQIN